MSTLEDRLRESLHQRATLPRLGEDLAGAAIQAARIRQRRRLTVGAVAAAMILVATVTGIALAGGPSAAPAPATTVGPAPSPTPDASQGNPTEIRLDVVDHGQLTTVEGLHLSLPGGPFEFLDRVPAGWLYGQFTEPATLLRQDGTSKVLTDLAPSVGGTDDPVRPAISSDGRSVAWVTINTLHAAKLTADGLSGLVSSPVPADSFALSWIADMVVVGHNYDGPCCGGKHAEYDVWDPTKGNFVAHWTRDIFPLADPVPGNVPAYTRVKAPGNGANEGCLVRVDGVTSMAPQYPWGCPAGLGWFSQRAMLSPNARYLLDIDQRDRRTAVYSVLDTGTTSAPVSHCTADTSLMWETNTTFIAFDKQSQRLARCTVGSDQPELLGRIGQAADWSLVPRYGI
jgi:hypothetical protein